MKDKRMYSITGTVTIKVIGNHPEQFFQKCITYGVPVWDVFKLEEEIYQGTIRNKHFTYLKEKKITEDYQVKIIKKNGVPFFLEKYMHKKPIFLAMLLTLLFIFLLSNIVWKVEVTGIPKEIEKKISNVLKSNGVYRGAWMFQLDPPSTIQSKLLEEIPELLWVGVEKKGTSLQIEGVEKLIVEEEEKGPPQDLIAKKAGVIQKIFVSKGKPQVNIHDFVRKETVLVSGNLSDTMEERNKKEETEDILVAAEGEVIAKTWYQVDVTVPLQEKYEELTGKQKTTYHLEGINVKIPIWNFRPPEYEDMAIEKEEVPFYFFHWKLPLTFTKSIYSEKQEQTLKRTKSNAIKIGKIQAEKHLELKLGPKAKIIAIKVLHENIEHDKVILTLYISVEEDIAKARPIKQKSTERK